VSGSVNKHSEAAASRYDKPQRKINDNNNYYDLSELILAMDLLINNVRCLKMAV
jgi:hypothetical protein